MLNNANSGSIPAQSPVAAQSGTPSQIIKHELLLKCLIIALFLTLAPGITQTLDQIVT